LCWWCDRAVGVTAPACVQVYKGAWRGTDVAVKRLLHQDIGKDSGMLDAFCQEV
jgi:hypothetical protein